MGQLPANSCFHRHFFEAFFMRLGLAAVVVWTLPKMDGLIDLTEQERPTGLAHFFDLTFLADPTIYPIFYWAAIAGLIFFVLGLAIPISLGIVTLVHIATLTLHNSQGSTTHAFQIVSLVLLAQWIVYLVAFFKKQKTKATDWAIHFSLHAIAAVYVIAGVIKLIRSRGLWAWQSPDISVELLKTNAQNYFNYLEIDAGYEHRLRIATWMIENPWLTRLLLGGGLMIELLAFLALRNRTWALIAGVFLLSLHWGIELTMGLNFRYNSAMIVIFLINVPFWISWLAGKIAKKNGPLDLPVSVDFPYRDRGK